LLKKVSESKKKDILLFQKGLTSRRKNDEDESVELNFKIRMALTSASNNAGADGNGDVYNDGIDDEIVLDEMSFTIDLLWKRELCNPRKKIPIQVSPFIF
jgi:hypothetical protein